MISGVVKKGFEKSSEFVKQIVSSIIYLNVHIFPNYSDIVMERYEEISKLLQKFEIETNQNIGNLPNDSKAKKILQDYLDSVSEAKRSILTSSNDIKKFYDIIQDKIDKEVKTYQESK